MPQIIKLFNQVLRFVVAHVDVVSAVLTDRPATKSLESKQELALLTAVLSRAALDGELCFLIYSL